MPKVRCRNWRFYGHEVKTLPTSWRFDSLQQAMARLPPAQPPTGWCHSAEIVKGTSERRWRTHPRRPADDIDDSNVSFFARNADRWARGTWLVCWISPLCSRSDNAIEAIRWWITAHQPIRICSTAASVVLAENAVIAGYLNTEGEQSGRPGK